MKSSTALCTPLFVHFHNQVDVLGRSLFGNTMISVSPRTAFGYRIPPTRVPGCTFEKPYDGQKGTFDGSMSLQRLDCVLTARGRETAGWQSEWRHIRAIQLDTEDQCPRREQTDETQKSHGRASFATDVSAGTR